MTSIPVPARYLRLFSPLEIGPITVRNRIMQTGHGKLYARDGVESRRNLDYQVARARGGIGLIVTGIHVVHPSAPLPRTAMAYLRESIEGDRRTTAAVRAHGARIFAQLGHTGSMFSSDMSDDLRVLWAPSPIRLPVTGETPKEMEREDIAEAVAWWAWSAEIAREADFDGVELHFAHTYLMHQFLSPTFNLRRDEYGGSLDNRMRFAREVIAEVRRRVGADFVVGVRMGMSDFMDGAFDVPDACEIARAFEAAGSVDYLSVSVGGLDKALEIAPSDLPDGHLVELASRIKGATAGIPIFAVGGIKDPAHAEAVLAAGSADMVAMTRAQLADPELANKAREGRESEIYRCIKGNQGCIGRGLRGLGIACTVNPVAGREGRYGGPLPPASVPSRWLVVGGGPAGMKAAETLAKRGHAVTLVEQEARLGGQVNLILKTPGRETFAALVEDLETQMRLHGVEVRLSERMTAKSVRELAPNGVIVATGAVPDKSGYSSIAPLVRRLPGAEQENVLTTWDVLLAERPVGRRVVVLDDDGTRAVAGVAEVLLDAGHDVELVSRFNALLPATALTLDMPLLYKRLLEKGLTYRLNSWADGIVGGTVGVFDIYTGAREMVDGVDTVVLATGLHADASLYGQLKGELASVYRIGDCVAPRKLDHAIYEGYLGGRELWSAAERHIVEGELERWEATRQADPVAAPA